MKLVQKNSRETSRVYTVVLIDLIPVKFKKSPNYTHLRTDYDRKKYLTFSHVLSILREWKWLGKLKHAFHTENSQWSTRKLHHKLFLITTN